jgi:hypothetical protein
MINCFEKEKKNYHQRSLLSDLFEPLNNCLVHLCLALEKAGHAMQLSLAPLLSISLSFSLFLFGSPQRDLSSTMTSLAVDLHAACYRPLLAGCFW